MCYYCIGDSMDKEELNEKIKELEYFINKQELNKSGYIMFLLITLFTILGGGLAIGLLFNNLAKIMMLAIASGVLINVKAISEIGKANDEIKRCSKQLSIYNNDLKNIDKKTTKVNKQDIHVSNNNYSYNPSKEKNDGIGRFDENDFDDTYNHKRR